MARCEICNKVPMVGNNVSHSNRHTRRQWKPNIQQTTIVQGGHKRTIKVCSRCLRTMAKSSN